MRYIYLWTIILLIVSLATLLFAAPVYSQGDTQGGFFDGLTVDAVYAHSLSNDMSGYLLMARLPLYQIDVGNLGVKAVFSANGSTFIDGLDGGFGLDVKLEGLIEGVNILKDLGVGIAYLPRGFGASYTLAYKRLY